MQFHLGGKYQAIQGNMRIYPRKDKTRHHKYPVLLSCKITAKINPLARKYPNEPNSHCYKTFVLNSFRLYFFFFNFPPLLSVKTHLGLGCSSEVECLPTLLKTLDSISSTPVLPVPTPPPKKKTCAFTVLMYAPFFVV